MSPRSQPVVIEIVGLDCSPKVAALMVGCWSRDIWVRWLSERGQGELMGSIRCTRIPFILIVISQSHLSPLSEPYSSNPLLDLKTHFSTGTIQLFFVMILTTPYAYESMFYVYPFSLSQSRLIASSFRDHDVSAYCQPHSVSTAYTLPIVIYF